MRIIAGQYRGRPIMAPAGRDTRPTSDRAREGLFSMLQSRIGSFEGLRIADLYAGTGALGLEALSRGAAHCTFVERSREAIDAIRSTVEKLGATDRVDLRSQAVEHVPAPATPFDIIFLDPPYSEGLDEAALERLAGPAWLAPGGWISLESESPPAHVPDGVTIEAERRFGRATIRLLRRSA